MSRTYLVSERTVTTTTTSYLIEAETDVDAHQAYTRMKAEDWPTLWSVQQELEEKEVSEIIVKEKSDEQN